MTASSSPLIDRRNSRSFARNRSIRRLSDNIDHRALAAVLHHRLHVMNTIINRRRTRSFHARHRPPQNSLTRRLLESTAPFVTRMPALPTIERPGSITSVSFRPFRSGRMFFASNSPDPASLIVVCDAKTAADIEVRNCEAVLCELIRQSQG